MKDIKTEPKCQQSVDWPESCDDKARTAVGAPRMEQDLHNRMELRFGGMRL
jgi:hypothetical protein